MEKNWKDIAKHLLRNRNIRQMVDQVINSLDEVSPHCLFPKGEAFQMIYCIHYDILTHKTMKRIQRKLTFKTENNETYISI